MLLVESAQSVANRMELAVWDKADHCLIKDLEGLPYIRVVHENEQSTELTNSILEAHRINSEYIMKTGSDFRKIFEDEIGIAKGSMVNWKRFYKALLKYDPSCLIHGCFLEELDGRLRVTRAISGFIEGRGVSPVESGGVKINILEPSLKGGEGNVIFHRVEFTCEKITAYFNLDLALINSYGLPKEASDLLVALSLLKVCRFLSEGLRLRTACDLEMKGELKVVRPEKGFSVPTEEVLRAAVKASIDACGKEGLFADPAVTIVKWNPTSNTSAPPPQPDQGQDPSIADAT